MTDFPLREHLPSNVFYTRLADRSNRLVNSGRCQTCGISFTKIPKDEFEGSTSYIMGGSSTEIKLNSKRKSDGLELTDSFLHIGTHGNFGHDVEIFRKEKDDQFYLTFCSPGCLRAYLNSLIDLIEERISQQRGMSKAAPGKLTAELVSYPELDNENDHVEGWVFDRKGKPIEDALVFLMANRGPRPAKASAKSDSLGFFRLPMISRLKKLIQSQKVIRCSVSKAGFESSPCQFHPEVGYQGVVVLKKLK